MLDKEDYLEPECALCGRPGEERKIRPVPVDRILGKIREDEDRNDWAAVERHLRYWLAEALQGGDRRGELTLRNELMGYYRKQGRRSEAYEHAEAALNLVEALGLENTVTAGTTWVNAGTVRVAFGEPEEGLVFFRKARKNYEENLPPEDPRRGGLYNNMGLALTGSGAYAEAEEMFRLALACMEKQPQGELEQAITWLNMADALEARLGPETAEAETEACLSKAEELLNTESLPRNGYYAFVCGKCAPVFGRYGWFITEAELKRRAGGVS